MLLVLLGTGGLAARLWEDATPPAAASPVTEASLDMLRRQAAAGDWPAARVLAARLLDRYESTRHSEDLFEVLVWLDMDWDDPSAERTRLVTRIFERHCQHRVLRWHWLCQPGE